MTQKVRTIPWMTKYTHIDQFTANNKMAAHPGHNFIFPKYHVMYNSGGSFDTNGVTWWTPGSNAAPSISNGTNFWGSTKFQCSMVNGKNYDQCIFHGSSVDDTAFKNSSFTYRDNAAHCNVRNAIGFACKNSIKGSYSDSGGDAQAYMQWLGLFYMNPTTRARVVYKADVKVAGSINMGSKYSNTNDYYYCYRISDARINDVRDKKLLLMGFGLQIYHSSRPAAHTSTFNLSQMRIIVGDGNGLVTYSNTNRLMICPVHDTVANFNTGKAWEVTS